MLKWNLILRAGNETFVWIIMYYGAFPTKLENITRSVSSDPGRKVFV